MPPTDISNLRAQYRTAVPTEFPERVTLTLTQKDGTEEQREFISAPFPMRYGSNPHQPCAAYIPITGSILGDMELLKIGKGGFSLTNLQDLMQAGNILKYFTNDGITQPSCVVMKHVNPCGFQAEGDAELSMDISTGVYGHKKAEHTFRQAWDCDTRSAFGSVVAFNYEVDQQTAEALMENFVEGVIAPSYTERALAVLKREIEPKSPLNADIRLGKIKGFERLPKYVGDDTRGFEIFRTLSDGTWTLEAPYLSHIKGINDLILEPMIPAHSRKGIEKDYIATVIPGFKQLYDCLTAWRVCISVRSNAIVIVKDHRTIAIGTGEQERFGSLEQAVEKADKKGHGDELRGAVLASDAFIPFPDCIEKAAEVGISAIVWPGGSNNDHLVIEAANKYGIALVNTGGERCFSHH